MDAQNARFRINLTAREIEIEGSEDFVRDYTSKLNDFLSALVALPLAEPVSEYAASVGAESATMESEIPEDFGAFLLSFPKGVSDVDKVLIAGYHVQVQSDQDVFTTRKANDLLKAQGVKVANASQAVKHQKKAKRVFTVKSGQYRVSQDGIEYLNSLTSSD
jgi:hypothetical protein